VCRNDLLALPRLWFGCYEHFRPSRTTVHVHSSYSAQWFSRISPTSDYNTSVSNEMNLLANAIVSIRVGVEDYEKGIHGRLPASVRSIHAGILFL